MKSRTLLALLVILGACKADHMLGTVEPDAGYNQAVTGTDTRPSISLDSPAFLADGNMPTMSQTLDAEGVDMEPLGPLGPSQSWTGYAENFQFPSGSDAIKFSFAYDPSGQVVGQVILGIGTPPPPATDPNVGYPPGYNGFNVLFADTEGFSFSMVGGSFVAHRLRFAIEGTEFWAGWCALQMPPADGSDGCLPKFMSATVGADSCSMTSASGKTIAVDCTKWYLCGDGFSSASVCLCTPTGCIPRPGRDTASFDMFISDDTASGSVSGYLNGISDTHNVHFTRDP